MYVSSNYFSTIGVTLPLGRGFTPADDASRAEAEAVISHRVWQMRFGSDPDIIGRTDHGQPDRIRRRRRRAGRFRGHVGGLNEPLLPAVAAALASPASDRAQRTRASQRDANWVRIVARLEPGTTRGAGGRCGAVGDGGACGAVSLHATRTRPAASSPTSPRARACGRRSRARG